MKNYHYKAKKGPSEIVEGVITADTKENAIDKVNDLGLVPVDIIEQAETPTASAAQKPVKRRVRSKDVLTFYMQLSRLVKSGVPLLQALSLLVREGERSALRPVTEDLMSLVRQGSSLSDALAMHPRYFSAFDIGMVQTGEAAGRLDEVLQKVASYRETQRELAGKVRGAVAYPAFIIVMSILTVAFMLTNVIPKFAGFFKDLGQELPLITRVLIGISEWMQAYWFWMAGACAALALLLMKLKKNAGYRLKVDTLFLKLPLIGTVLLKAEIAKLCRTLELLLKSGVSVLSALRIAVPVMSNEALKHDVQNCHGLLEQGGNLSEGFRNSKYIPSFVSYFVGMGEESGRLEESLKEIAEWYEKDTQEAVKIMTGLLEPAIILIVGGILAFIIIAVLLPVFSINAMV